MTRIWQIYSVAQKWWTLFDKKKCKPKTLLYILLYTQKITPNTHNTQKTNTKNKHKKTNLKNITHFTTNNLTKQTEMWYIIHTTRKSTNKSN